jgi:hypothetical protein
MLVVARFRWRDHRTAASSTWNTSCIALEFWKRDLCDVSKCLVFGKVISNLDSNVFEVFRRSGSSIETRPRLDIIEIFRCLFTASAQSRVQYWNRRDR